MKDSLLVTYMQDHIAGSRLAVDLLKSLHKQYESENLGRFALELHNELEQERKILKDITERFHGARTNVLKESVAWVTEKLSRLKFHHLINGDLGTFQSLESLALGILGKRGLWKVLKEASADSRLQDADFDELIKRAEDQHAMVEERRMQIGQELFGS